MAATVYQSKVSELSGTVNTDVIKLDKLRTLCFSGCPDEHGLRALSWKILLNYLPRHRDMWEAGLRKDRKTYREFIEEMIVKPGSKCQGEGSAVQDVTAEDHPLNPNPSSEWGAYFKDNDQLLQIDKDCRRLLPDLSFFQSATSYPCKALVGPGVRVETLRKRVEQCFLKADTVKKNMLGITNAQPEKRKQLVATSLGGGDSAEALGEGEEAHWEVCERILFIYGKLNPGQGYVQGMNEILGPLYYIFATDPDPAWRVNAEADTFFCFTNLMSEIRDMFIKTLDDSESGIDARMIQIMALLAEKDPALSRKLNQQSIKPQFFAFRWLTLMYSQEFPLPDVLRLWDSFLADSSRFSMLNYVGVAMLVLIREQLLEGDFPTNMKLIQNFPASDIHLVLNKAVELRGFGANGKGSKW